jgi:DUF218 domain-containing protein
MGEARQTCDAIFVLAGAAARKAYGLELYRQEVAPRIVLSVARFEIRRLEEQALPAPVDLLNAARGVPPAERHFFVEFDAAGARFERSRRGRFGTLAEIAALAEWCEKNRDVESLMVISSGYHLRRVRLCCRKLLPGRVQCVFVKTPEEKRAPAGWLLLEVLKLAAYGAMLGSGYRPRGQGAGPI